MITACKTADARLQDNAESTLTLSSKDRTGSLLGAPTARVKLYCERAYAVWL